MKALTVHALDGPDAVSVCEADEPDGNHSTFPGPTVTIDVHAAGLAFPDLLLARGQYQDCIEAPFVLGTEVAGLVRAAPADSELQPGDRVAAFTFIGGAAEVAVAPAHLTFPLPNELSMREGAALILNYHTAYLALAVRGGLQPGETVVVHGAAGGVGTAAIQVSKALGATTVAVASTAEKADVARHAGADDVIGHERPWRDELRDGLGNQGVDVILDPVGGARTIDSLRALKPAGRLLVVGFASGDVPDIAANRLLLRNVSAVGVAWGAWVSASPLAARSIGDAINHLVRRGDLRPQVRLTLPLSEGAAALRAIEQRQALGKVIVDVRGDAHV